MPISFWKDHSADAKHSFDLTPLREKYIDDGRKVAQRLMKDREVLAIWLSGPFEYPRVSPNSDLHIAVFIHKGRETFYHHQLPPFSEVGRRLEIAFFPLNYLQSALERGCTEWATLFDLHKLSETIILYERDGILSRMIGKLEGLKPTKLFVGREIQALKSEFGLMERLLNEGKYEESMLSSRQILWHTLKLLLLVKNGLTFSKLSDLYPKRKSHFSPSLAERFEVIQTVKGIGKLQAEKRIKETKDLVKFIFEREGV